MQVKAPQLSGRPLLDIEPDRALFVPPKGTMDVLRRSVERQLNVLVLGGLGIGKTTLLRQLAYELEHDGGHPVFVDAGVAETPAAFLQLVRYTLGIAPTPIEALGAGLAAGFRPAPPPGTSAELVQLVQSLRPEGEEAAGAAVILVDSLDPDQAHTVFGRLRDEVWQLPYTWVVAGEERARGRYLSPPADAFFDVVLSIPRWGSEDLEEILDRRLSARDVTGRQRKTLVQLADGNPRRLLALARESVVEGRDASAIGKLRAERLRHAAELGRDHSMVLAELEAHGPVSASDEDFLRRMGWPRERAARVLKDLERAGITRGVSRPGESGRPRRVYEVREPSQAS